MAKASETPTADEAAPAVEAPVANVASALDPSVAIATQPGTVTYKSQEGIELVVTTH